MQIKFFLNILLLLSTAIFLPQLSHAQTIEEVASLFSAGNYYEAKVASDAILKKSPNNVAANFYYGVSCYKLNDWISAEKYLKIAASKKNAESQRYLGELYFLSYRFDESISAYKAYIEANKKNEALTQQFNEKIEKATLGKNMLKRVEDVKIIDSLIVDKTNFFTQYKLNKSAGKLIYANDFFNNTEYGSEAVLYQPEKENRIIYAKQNDDNLDLFAQDKLFDGYGNEKDLGKNINTLSDENYPFLLNDGITFYFSSTNEQSLGGYDIFVTRYNPDSDSYLAAENMGMPFNSPYNDYMLVIDEVNNVGWFASDRYQAEGKVIIYLFIPNEEKTIIRNEDSNYLINRAKINSIRETWEENDDFSSLLQKIYADKSTQKVEEDFRFIIADNLIYTSLSDFKNNTARNLYKEAQDNEKKFNQLKEHLEKLRTEYATASQSTKQKLTAEILRLEKEEIKLKPEIDANYIKARNEEVRFLMKK